MLIFFFFGCLSYIIHQLISQWIIDINIKPETRSETPREKQSCYTFLGNDLSGQRNQSTSNKDKNEDVDLCQTEKLLHSKGAKNKMKKQLMKCEKLYANHLSNKGSKISKICRHIK